MQLMDVAAAAGGHYYGRVYRNRHDYRRHYRERANVGGFFGSILNSSEFDFFLTCLCALVAFQGFTTLSHAPVTTIILWFMLYLYYEKPLWGAGRTVILTPENYHSYSFHAQRILQGGQWYRLLTGVLLHDNTTTATGREGRRKAKLHLYLNALGWIMLGPSVEAAWSTSTAGYAMFVVVTTVTAGLAYIACLQNYGDGHATRVLGETQQAARPQSYQTPGLTGVIFAFKSYFNTIRVLGASWAVHYAYRGGIAHPSTLSMGGFHGSDYMSLAGHFRGLGLPFSIPSHLSHLAELIVVTILFGQDAPFWANVGGVLAGYVMVAVELAAVSAGWCSGPWMMGGGGGGGSNSSYGTYHHAHTTTNTKPWMDPQTLQNAWAYGRENGVWIALAVGVLTYVYLTTQGRERELQRRLEEMERRQQPQRQQQGRVLQGSRAATRPPAAAAPPVETVEAASSVSDQGSWSVMMASSGGGDSDDLYDDHDKNTGGSKTGDSLYDEVSALDDGSTASTLPSGFTTALITLCTVTEDKPQDLVEETLELLIKIIGNAVTKGQQPGEEGQKYRRVRVSNRRLQKCNIEGAFDVLLATGFFVREDFDGEKWLTFPLIPNNKDVIVDEDDNAENHDWVPSALDALQAQLVALKATSTTGGDGEPNMDPDEMKRRVRKAALRRQAAAVTKKRRPRESQFAPGMGGGNSKAVFFKGGT